MSEKKRKRSSQGDALQPPKKHSFKPKHDKISVELIPQEGDQLPPILAVPTAIRLPEVPLVPHSRRMPDIEVAHQEFILQSSNHPKLDFQANENFGHSADVLLDNYIGVYDPATNKLQLHRAKRMKVAALLRPTQEQLDEARIAKTYQTNIALRQQLGMQFGTKKAKNMIRSLAENSVTATPAEDGKMDATTQALIDSIGEKVAVMPTPAEQAHNSSESAPKPPANLDAKSPKDVYPLGLLVPSEVLHSIDVDEWMEKAKGMQAVSLRSRFIAKRISNAGLLGDEVKMKVLRYMSVAIEFYLLLKGGRVKKVPGRKEFMGKLAYEPSLVDAVTKRFLISSPREMNQWEIDNLITHLCAMSLFVDGWETDTTDLKGDLQLETKKVIQYFQELGCRIGPMNEKDRNAAKLTAAEAKVRRMARLVIPLDFPRLSKGPRGKK